MREFVRRILATSLLSILLVALLSLIPLLTSNTKTDSSDVIVMGTPRQLTSARLVDLVNRHKKLPLRQMDWRGSVIVFEGEQPTNLSESALYQVCFLFLRDIFVSFSQVETIHLYIHTRQPTFSFRIQAHRSQLKKDPSMENNYHLSSKEYLQKMFTWIRLDDQ